MSNSSASINRSPIWQPLVSSRYAAAVFKAVRLVRSGKTSLLISIPCYRLWWRLRGLDYSIVSIHDLGLNPELANYHKDGGGPLLRALLNQLQISSNDVALDLGSGKGGAMATMARYPFRRVDGVEIAPELVEAARKNLAKLQLAQCHVYLADATTFTELDNYTHIFMYNPFPEVVMKQVLANLDDSLRRKPRDVQLIYSNPLHERTILTSGSFKKSFDFEPYPEYRISVYQNT